VFIKFEAAIASKVSGVERKVTHINPIQNLLYKWPGYELSPNLTR